MGWVGFKSKSRWTPVCSALPAVTLNKRPNKRSLRLNDFYILLYLCVNNCHSPLQLCFGSQFLSSLTVSIAITGTALFRPPRGTRNAVIVIVVIVFFYIAFTLVLGSFLGGDYHYTTIIFHTTKVNIDIGTKILKAKFAGRKRHFFDTPQKFKPICV